MEEAGGGGGDRREGGGGGGDSAFIRWLTRIHEEIDSTADTLKDAANVVKVRKITPHLDILKAGQRRPGSGRARSNAVIGLDDAISEAIKNLQSLRTNLREECQQFFVNVVPVNRMEETSQTFYSTQPMTSAPGQIAASDIMIDYTSSESRGDSSEVQVIPPRGPLPEPVAGCSHNPRNDGRARIIITKHQKTDEAQGGIDGRHNNTLSAIPSSQDKKDPRDLLSPECWMLVFDKVEDPQDWLNLYRTSPYFQDVVEDKRTTALFPQVLGHVIPHLGKNLDEILGLRRVCRHWKTAADTLLENSDSSAWVGVDVRSRLEGSYNFEYPSRISSFLKRFETHAGNPFAGRFVFLRYYFCSRVIAEYNVLASQLLDKYGAHLRRLRVAIDHTSFGNVVSRLERCLQQVPNLEYLRVQCFNYSWDDPTGGDGHLLSPCIAKELLPLLPNLKSIAFSISGKADRAGIFGLQNAVVRLSCNPNSLKSVETIGFPSALDALPNLKSAEVILYTVVDCYSTSLPSTPWPLSKLTVSNYFDGKLGPLFKCVEHFKATLTELRFKCTLTYEPEPLVELKLDLPHLKQLTIEAYPSMSLEFLTNLRNLEVLSIHHNPNFRLNVKTELHELIEFVQAEVIRSGLWEDLLKLTKIYLFGVTRGDLKTNNNGAHRTLNVVATRSNWEFRMSDN